VLWRIGMEVLMLLVTQQEGTGPMATRPGVWDRIMTHARSFALDGQLADGASPEATVQLALRAQQLTSMRERRGLAAGIENILASVTQPPRSHWSPVPVCRDRVRDAASDFQALAGKLLTPAPVPAQGVAQTSMLLHDGGGPLYRRSSPDDLRARIRQAAAALDVLAGQ
jgi:hypothetical protein